ncbi:hypothetical protein D9756_002235 [Leucocoprinus leucothites]|uniref:F-box domain-containing protein n=1 Tax=Leucocoprinus leucothites TaxID=201217 RepID=A0A8H5GCF4_9AGAR|nr:hypothetical protein D9756_002235 [Leucoagaricus leucothites]
MHTLPLEILSKIFMSLPCIELTRISRVCLAWRDFIQSDLYLQRACFKQPSIRYFDEGTEPGPIPAGVTAHMRFHPVMPHISYQMGEASSFVYVRSNDVNQCRIPLTELPLNNDFATIPTVKHMEIEILPDEMRPSRKARGLPGLKVSVSNPTGVRLGDIFLSIVTESTERCDLVAYASGGQIRNQWMTPSLTFQKKAEILGKQKSYAGIKGMTIENGLIKVKLRTTL